MRRSTVRYGLIGGMLGIAMAGTSTVYAADTKWYDAIAASGYLQTSYTGNLSSPHDGPAGGNTGAKLGNQGRQFDTDANSFNFNAFLLQIAKPVGDDKVGFTTRFRTGQDSQLVSPGGSSFWVQEAYITFAPLAKLSLIGGKFVTSEGVEVVDTVNNPNFSEGLLFTWAEPIGHTGLKANYAFSDKINATLGLVNGWDGLPTNQGAPDINSAKTVIWQLATTPMKGLGWSFQGTYGKELPDPSHSERLSLDTVLTYTMGKLSLAGQLNWGQQTNDPTYATNGGGTAAGTSHWQGAGIWATFAETEKCSTSARFEVLGDENFANRFGTAPAAFPSGSTNQTIKEFTITQKHMFTPAMGVRGEYRHDWSTEAYFFGKEGGGVTNQNTVSADWFVTF
jgi:hypothetical protein